MSSRGDKLLPPHTSPPPASPHHIPPTRHPKMTPDPFMCLYQAAKVRNSDESLWLRVYTSESRKEGNQPRSAKSGEVRENSCSPPGLQWFSSRRENLFHVIPAAAENRRPAGNSHCVRVPRSRQLGDSERWMSAEQTAGFIQRRCWNEMLAGEFVACNFLQERLCDENRHGLHLSPSPRDKVVAARWLYLFLQTIAFQFNYWQI